MVCLPGLPYQIIKFSIRLFSIKFIMIPVSLQVNKPAKQGVGIIIIRLTINGKSLCIGCTHLKALKKYYQIY